MLRFHKVGIAALTFTLLASAAAAQAVSQKTAPDSLWNGTLVGLGAEVGTAAALDIVDEAKTTLRLLPIVGPGRKEVLASLVPQPGRLPPLMKAQERAPAGRRDSVWNGTLIGAGIGAAGGAVWGVKTCGANDNECFAIAGPVGILGGAGIGAVVGAIADALHD